MDPAAAGHFKDSAIGNNDDSKALFIAEILAGCAGVILIVAFLCCFFTGANQRQARLALDQFIDPVAEEIQDSGRRTPDAAPAYSTTSPLGPLSPEVVNAISCASADFRQSLVISILSSSRSLQRHTETSSMENGVRTAHSSIVSSVEDVPSLPSLSASPRSSMNSEQPSEDPSDELSSQISRPHRWEHSVARGSRVHMQNLPPSYDPAWRAALVGEQGDTGDHPWLPPPLERDAHFRSGSSQGRRGGQRSEWHQFLLASPLHRRAESSPSRPELLHLQHPSIHPRGLVLHPHLPVSGRSLSWTGEAISQGSRSGQRSSLDQLPRRSNLSSSWSPPPATMDSAAAQTQHEA